MASFIAAHSFGLSKTITRIVAYCVPEGCVNVLQGTVGTAPRVVGVGFRSMIVLGAGEDLNAPRTVEASAVRAFNVLSFPEARPQTRHCPSAYMTWAVAVSRCWPNPFARRGRGSGSTGSVGFRPGIPVEDDPDQIVAGRVGQVKHAHLAPVGTPGKSIHPNLNRYLTYTGRQFAVALFS